MAFDLSSVPFGPFDQKQEIVGRPDNQSFVFHDWRSVVTNLRQGNIKNY